MRNGLKAAICVTRKRWRKLRFLGRCVTCSLAYAIATEVTEPLCEVKQREYFVPVSTWQVYSVFVGIESKLSTLNVCTCIRPFFLAPFFIFFFSLEFYAFPSWLQVNPRNFVAPFLLTSLRYFRRKSVITRRRNVGRYTPRVVRQSIRQLNKCCPPRCQRREISSFYNFPSRNASNYTGIEWRPLYEIGRSPTSKKFTRT